MVVILLLLCMLVKDVVLSCLDCVKYKVCDLLVSNCDG